MRRGLLSRCGLMLFVIGYAPMIVLEECLDVWHALSERYRWRHLPQRMLYMVSKRRGGGRRVGKRRVLAVTGYAYPKINTGYYEGWWMVPGHEAIYREGISVWRTAEAAASHIPIKPAKTPPKT